MYAQHKLEMRTSISSSLQMLHWSIFNSFTDFDECHAHFVSSQLTSMSSSHPFP